MSIGNQADQVFSKLQEIIAEEFSISPDSVTRETSAEDVDGWDSISHATLMMTLETAFGVTFDDEEIFSIPHVGALGDRITVLKYGP